jgi:hypothetical protein
MNNIFDLINKLPHDIVHYEIKQFIPKKVFVFTNKKNYILYHQLIKQDIINYENYIRDTIRRDNYFVFERIVRENYKKWFEFKKYMYKNIIFKNYACFAINYCIENESTNCRKIMNCFFEELGLDKNQHKKNFVKYIKWKN